MNCPQCSNPMILTRATNFGDEYEYCRQCKKELKEMKIAPIKGTETQPDSALEFLLKTSPGPHIHTCTMFHLGTANPACIVEPKRNSTIHFAAWRAVQCVCGQLELNPYNGFFELKKAIPPPTTQPFT